MQQAKNKPKQYSKEVYK